MTEAGITYREQDYLQGAPERHEGIQKPLCYGNTVAKSISSSALALLSSLVCCVLWRLPKLLVAELAAVAVPV